RSGHRRHRPGAPAAGERLKRPRTRDASAPPEGGVGAAVSARQTFIEETAIALGQTWARDCRRDLHREGRAASGGWPGTMNEARAIVGHAFIARMRSRGMSAITEQEHALAVRTAYASARSEWCRHVDPEGP